MDEAAATIHWWLGLCGLILYHLVTLSAFSQFCLVRLQQYYSFAFCNMSVNLGAVNRLFTDSENIGFRRTRYPIYRRINIPACECIVVLNPRS